ncbi:MAG: LytTR family transcriptional regulator [Proteobacteria bacterium]|nr:MAG: LytTR family transcriptional regulator [Pseudomonadota bacterium]
MIGAFPLAFTTPWLLLGLLSLPVLWWLLRVTPPRPRRIAFPPARLLFDIGPKEETPARTPWWLTALRLLAAALVILAAAGPMWNPHAGEAGRTGPLVLMIDDGWAAAASWDTRIEAADDLIAQADAGGRGIALVPLSEPTRDLTLMTAGTARVALRQLAPKPYAVERIAALPNLARFLATLGEADIVWLSDGIDAGRGQDFVAELAKALGERPLTIYGAGTPPALALAGAENAAARMTVKVLRATPGGSGAGIVRALDQKGAPLGEATYQFAAGARDATANFDLPVELRNDIARLEIAGERSAGAVQLLDKRWRRRAIGIVSGASADTAQPLLASTFYLTRALSPFADIRLAERAAPAQAVAQFLDDKLPMIILADVGALTPDLRARLTAWIEGGGVLVRFAGPRLAQADDGLVPVKLRLGDRNLGGSLTWEKPQQLAAFAADGPFASLRVPDDVTVTRQVLAEPNAELASRSWASLADGTPLVTGERRGKGVLALFHISADMRWSNLPMSGAFVEMLQQVVDMAGTTAREGAGAANADVKVETVAPLRTLDGFGAFVPPPPTARPLSTDFRGRASADHPPGFYGPADGPLAVNTLTGDDTLAPLEVSALNARQAAYGSAEPRDLRGATLATALALFLIDALIIALLGGSLAALMRRRPARAATLMLIAATALVALSTPSHAADETAAIRAVSQTRLAYVVTGNTDVDEIAKAGLTGLTMFLAQRTALEPGDPVGVDPARDELAFFPLIYWPVVSGQPKPSADTLNRIDAYMKQGGTVLFDTRDAIEAPPGSNGAAETPGMLQLRTILSSLDIPELEPVPREHVLAKTFYLLHDFPGRYATGQTWVEALPREQDEDSEPRPARGGDGVSPIIITSNDLAGAWAIRHDGQAMLPLSDAEPRQREFAFRAGVNIVMYVLTGNYKTDQVHAPALIERLGQ